MRTTYLIASFSLIACLCTAPAMAQPRIDANGDDEITESEYVAYQMLSFNDKDENYDGRITKDEQRAWGVKQQREQMKEAFKQIDPNNDGRMTEDEFVESASKGIEAQIARAEDKTNNSFDEMDSDNNGSISRKEYSAAHNQKLQGYVEEIKRSTRLQFKLLDKDKDGIVTDTEYAGIVSNYKNVVSLEDDSSGNVQVRARVMLDKNSDGTITRTEQREYSVHAFNGFDANKDGIVTKGEAPFLFGDADGSRIVIESSTAPR